MVQPKRPGLRKLLKRMAVYDLMMTPGCDDYFPEIKLYSDESGSICDPKGKIIFSFSSLKQLKKHLAELPELEEDEEVPVSKQICTLCDCATESASWCHETLEDCLIALKKQNAELKELLGDMEEV